MAKTYFYEFLVRGNEDGTVAWHVIQAAEGIDTFGRPFHDERVLNMTQAAEVGVTLPDIIAAINTTTMTELEAARIAIAQNAEIADEVKSLRASLLSAHATIDQMLATPAADAAPVEVQKPWLSKLADLFR